MPTGSYYLLHPSTDPTYCHGSNHNTDAEPSAVNTDQYLPREEETSLPRQQPLTDAEPGAANNYPQLP